MQEYRTDFLAFLKRYLFPTENIKYQRKIREENQRIYESIATQNILWIEGIMKTIREVQEEGLRREGSFE